ncbi:MAG: type IV toxin-antitoxin system AbiEi family antitoxin domain-containing protein [Actinomycetes bacterium]
MDPRLAARALARGGVFTRADALACGYSPDEIVSRLRTGAWTALRRGVYADSRPEPGDERVLAAALAVLAPSAALSHRSAALIHGLPLLGEPPTAVDVTVPGAAARRRPDLVVHGRALPAGQVTVVRRLRVTDVARTALDLARRLPLPDAVVAVDAALAAGAARGEALRDLLELEVGPFSGHARRVVEFADGRSESPGESLSRVAIASHGLPAPQLQAWVHDSAGPIGRVDFLWPEQRVVGEFDGRLKYRRPEDLWAEKRREDRLRENHEVVRWVWSDAVGDFTPVAGRIRAAFARGAARVAGSLPHTLLGYSAS